MTLTAEVLVALGPTGPLRQLPHYEPRPEQTRLARRIAAVMENKGRLVAEAGTGVGKSMGYLIPAVMSGEKVIISTFTKTLQDQLLSKDIPFLIKHFRPFVAAKIKGRQNYLCLYKLREHDAGARDPLLQSWIAQTGTGDMDEYPGLLLPELRRSLTISSEDCLHRKCPLFKDCWAERAKYAAAAADVIIVNHALLMLDLEDKGSLPKPKHIIIDEAHHLVDAAAGAQEVSFTLYRLNNVLRAKVAKIDLFPQDVGGRISSVVHTWLQGFAERMRGGDKESYDSPLPFHAGPLDEINGLIEWWKAHGASVRDRVSDMTLMDASAREIAMDQIEKALDRLLILYDELKDLTNPGLTDSHAYWVQRNRGHNLTTYSLHRSPTDMGPWLADRLWKVGEDSAPSVIAVSATLSQGPDFSHFLREAGAEGATTHIEGSPFDYPNQALYYVPLIPPPNGARDSEDREAGMAYEILRTIEATSGGVFVLFTSWTRCRNMYDRLHDRLAVQRPTYMQGEYPPLELISRFKEDGNAVLFATRGFWEGVDVEGDALRVVIIDRLPFPTPADPIYQAKSRALENAGLRPFFALAVPAASLALKQGLGRLIRSQDDRGVVVFLDDRLVSKGYGKTIRASLPNAPLTRNFEEVADFLDDVDILF